MLVFAIPVLIIPLPLKGFAPKYPFAPYIGVGDLEDTTLPPAMPVLIPATTPLTLFAKLSKFGYKGILGEFKGFSGNSVKLLT